MLLKPYQPVPHIWYVPEETVEVVPTGESALLTASAREEVDPAKVVLEKENEPTAI